MNRNTIWLNYGVWAIEYWCDIIRAAIIGQLFVGHNPLGTNKCNKGSSQITDNGWVAWGWKYVLCHPNLQFVLMSDCDGMPADLFVSSLINSTGNVTRGKYDHYKNQIKYCLKILPIIRLIKSIKSDIYSSSEWCWIFLKNWRPKRQPQV